MLPFWTSFPCVWSRCDATRACSDCELYFLTLTWLKVTGANNLVTCINWPQHFCPVLSQTYFLLWWCYLKGYSSHDFLPCIRQYLCPQKSWGLSFHISELILSHLLSEQQLLICHLNSLISDLVLPPVPIMLLLLQPLKDVYVRHQFQYINAHLVLGKLTYKKETCFKMLMGICARDTF